MSTITEALGALTFSQPVPDDELVSDAIVLIRLVHRETGGESFIIATSDGIGPITQIGLIVAAHDVFRSGSTQVEE